MAMGTEGASGGQEGRRLDRAAIVAALREIAALLALRGGSKFKVRAFDRGANALESLNMPLAGLDDVQLREVPGIGFALAEQILMLRDRGHSELLESLRAGLPSGVLELSQVSGIGLHTLELLHKQLGVASVEDLRDAARAGRLRSVQGFGEKKEAKILEAIERYEATPTRVTLADGLRLADSIQSEVAAMPGVIAVELAGSLRRYAELSNEIVFVVVTCDPAPVVDQLVRMPRVASVREQSEKSCQLRLADGTRVVFETCGAEELPAAIVGATSTPEHFGRLVERARIRDLHLDHRGLWKASTRVSLPNEAALYRELGLAPVPAEMREDEGEIERATNVDRFELVELSDLRGFVHCHTTWSDGKSGVEEMARAAEERGAEFITVTDHSHAAHYARGLDLDRLQRQWDEIAAVQERVRIRILRGSEVDILADGALDMPDRILEQLDVVIASIHARHKQDEAEMTARVVRAIRHPAFKIWGHPLGRLVTSRPPIPVRMDEVIDALAESRVAIEISGDPARLDLEPRWARVARERGVPFVLSVDAHSIRNLDNVRYAVGLARRAGISKCEVLNAFGPEDFLRAVRPAA